LGYHACSCSTLCLFPAALVLPPTTCRHSARLPATNQGIACAPLSPLLQLGLMATYILDALRYKEGAFMSAW
jgi:hypothetical protein